MPSVKSLVVRNVNLLFSDDDIHFLYGVTGLLPFLILGLFFLSLLFDDLLLSLEPYQVGLLIDSLSLSFASVVEKLVLILAEYIHFILKSLLLLLKVPDALLQGCNLLHLLIEAGFTGLYLVGVVIKDILSLLDLSIGCLLKKLLGLFAQ